MLLFVEKGQLNHYNTETWNKKLLIKFSALFWPWCHETRLVCKMSLKPVHFQLHPRLGLFEFRSLWGASCSMVRLVKYWHWRMIGCAVQERKELVFVGLGINALTLSHTTPLMDNTIWENNLERRIVGCTLAEKSLYFKMKYLIRTHTVKYAKWNCGATLWLHKRSTNRQRCSFPLLCHSVENIIQRISFINK